MSTIEEQPDPENLTAEQAFQQSGEMHFQGELLRPSRKRCEYAAQALGNRVLCGTANITPGMTSLYEGFLTDVIVMLYLCRCNASEVLQAHRKPDHILEAALTWGDERGISQGSEAFAEAANLYWDIFAQIQAGRFKVKAKEGQSGGNA